MNIINKIFLPIINYFKGKKADRILNYYHIYETYDSKEKYGIKFRQKITILMMMDEDYMPFIEDYINRGIKYNRQEIINKL